MNLDCSPDAKVFHHPAHSTIITVHVIASACGLGLNVQQLRAAFRNRANEISFMILINIHMIFSFVHCGLQVGFQGYHLSKVFSTVSDCDLFMPMETCHYFRYTAGSCGVGYVVIHASMCIDRAIASFKVKTYYHWTQFICWSMAILSVVASVIFPVIITTRPSDSGYMQYCIGGTPSNYNSIILYNFAMVAIDIAVSIYYSWLKRYNMKLKRRRAFRLRESYQINENIYVLKCQIPIFWMHTVFVFAYGLAQAIIFHIPEHMSQKIFEVIRLSIYVFPFYDVLTPLLLMWLKTKIKRERAQQVQDQVINKPEEFNMSFIQLRQMWDPCEVVVQNRGYFEETIYENH